MGSFRRKAFAEIKLHENADVIVVGGIKEDIFMTKNI